MNGYFQSFRYFHPNHSDLVRKSFQFLPEIGRKARMTLTQITNRTSTTNFVGVHVRHGMDLTMHQRNQRHGHVVAPATFFANAMSELRKADENTEFVVATDDMAWVRKNFIGINEFQSDRKNGIIWGNSNKSFVTCMPQLHKCICCPASFARLTWLFWCNATTISCPLALLAGGQPFWDGNPARRSFTMADGQNQLHRWKVWSIKWITSCLNGFQ